MCLDVKISSISQPLKLCWLYISLSRILLSQTGVLHHLCPISVELSQRQLNLVINPAVMSFLQSKFSLLQGELYGSFLEVPLSS